MHGKRLSKSQTPRWTRWMRSGLVLSCAKALWTGASCQCRMGGPRCWPAVTQRPWNGRWQHGHKLLRRTFLSTCVRAAAVWRRSIVDRARIVQGDRRLRIRLVSCSGLTSGSAIIANPGVTGVDEFLSHGVEWCRMVRWRLGLPGPPQPCMHLAASTGFVCNVRGPGHPVVCQRGRTQIASRTKRPLRRVRQIFNTWRPSLGLNHVSQTGVELSLCYFTVWSELSTRYRGPLQCMEHVCPTI